MEIDVSGHILTVAFAANGEYIVGGGNDRVEVWRVEDGTRMATMEAPSVRCLAASKDGRWIAAGTLDGDVIMWDAKTFEKVFAHKEVDYIINGVDFSPDSTRLVTASWNSTATIWDLAAREKVRTLDHEGRVVAAKYSPRGDRIATATRDSVRVWGSDDGRLLVDIPVKVTPYSNNGLLWSNSHLFVVPYGTIKQIEASTGSTVSEWPAPDTDRLSCIALPKHGGFIAYFAKDTITFWNTSTDAQLSLIQLPQNPCSIAISPDHRFLATGGEGGKITVGSLSRIIVSVVFLWITAYLSNFLVFSSSQIGFHPNVSSVSHFPGTCHSDRRRCAPFMEVQSARERGRIIDRSHRRVSESKPSCTR